MAAKLGFSFFGGCHPAVQLKNRILNGKLLFRQKCPFVELTGFLKIIFTIAFVSVCLFALVNFSYQEMAPGSTCTSLILVFMLNMSTSVDGLTSRMMQLKLWQRFVSYYEFVFLILYC